jgi:3'(2'), 5'-bisphosphate nucleotidase
LADELVQDADSIDSIIGKGVKLPLDAGDRPFTVVGSRSHMSAETEAFIEELRAKHEQLEFSSRGSSLKLCMVAEGKADIYPRFAPTMEWDTAAGQAIAECSGASVLQSLSLERVRYNKEDLLNPWFIVQR